jgi:PKD repeat protein
MSKKSAPVISNVSVTPASGPGGTIFTASVTASGFPSLRIAYQWRLDGAAIPAATGASHIASTAGTLTVLVTATNNQGTDMRESAPVTVSPALAAPAISEARIAPETGAVEDVFTAVAEASGVPAPTLGYQWALDGIAIGGATEASYIAVARGNLNVRVTARNSEGADSVESDPVAVEPAATAPAIGALRIGPEAGRVGEPFSAIVEASGTPSPDLGYQWMLDGVAIEGATAVSFTAVAEGALSVWVTATNGAGTDSRISVAVPVTAALVAPEITAATISPASGRVGDSFSVAVTASGEPVPELNYQWRIEGVEIGGATGSTFVPALSGSLSVQVTASNSEGSDTLETTPVPVSAALSAPVIASITFAPSTGRVGDAFTGVAQVMGEPSPEVAFQWLLDGVAVEGAIGPSFVPTTAGALSLRATATNSQGADVRESAPVLLEPALEVPRLTGAAIAPEAGRVGDLFTVTAGATGEPAPVLSYQWLLDGLPIAGATGTELVAGSEGNLSVRVTASNVAGSDSLETAVAIVSAALTAPAITGLSISPESGRVGDSFSIAVQVAGNPAPLLAYRWLLDGAAVEGATEPAFIASAAGALRVLVTATSSEGSDNLLSIPVLVGAALAAPKVTSADILPSNGRVGDTFTIASTAVGFPPPDLRYVWVLEDRVIEGASGISYTATEVGTLFVRVIATNSEGEDIRESGAVEVEPALVAPSITDATIQPSSGRVGDTFFASVIAAGNPAPVLSFQWLINGVEVAGANAGSFVPLADGSLSVRVTATNSEGVASAESAAVALGLLEVAPINIAAPVLTGTASPNNTLIATAGDWAGNPEPQLSFAWQRNGADITGATGLSLLLRDLDFGTDVRIRVEATNSVGSAVAYSSSFRVTAGDAPVIGPLSDAIYQRNSGIQSYDIGALTIGTGIAWSIEEVEITAGPASLEVSVLPALLPITAIAAPAAIYVEPAA